ncbi:hypothetical protein MSAN_00616300 [Mycena sanguinolenta]|uniref:HMG box domain-containing protein n=1 Tax=Mycena sanguinolenta TaxID=230812 RepID=A0A8H6Z2Y9_9AGAR|nr:hypothetical protein MSAN_00616300 [Mycena sanguinolenta]
MSAAPSPSPEPNLDDPQGERGGLDECPLTKPSRAKHSRKQPEGHIPRPPNAFILFRSSFVRNQLVSPDVETNPTTISKIIGLTWKNLPADERRVWYAKAREAVEEHRRRFPDYAFRPSQRRGHGGGNGKPERQKEARRKVRQRVVENPERCVRIAELLGEGKHGQALDGAMQEFDRERMSGIVTRFEPPHGGGAPPAPARRLDSGKLLDPLSISLSLWNRLLAQPFPLGVPLETNPVDFSTFSFNSRAPVIPPRGTLPASSPPTTTSDLALVKDHWSILPELDLGAFVNEVYTHDVNTLSAPSSSLTLSPMGAYPYNFDAGLSAPAFIPDTEPGLSQIEADFMKLMAQYSLDT